MAPEQEKEHLEEQLMQTVNMLQQLEAQLQAFQKSCLLQLACSSWLGRVLRSQTGSVEVSQCPRPTSPTASQAPLPSPPWTFLGWSARLLQAGASAGASGLPRKPAPLRLLLQGRMVWLAVPPTKPALVWSKEYCLEGVLFPSSSFHFRDGCWELNPDLGAL